MSMNILCCEGHQSDVAALFATSVRDYLDACKTACNLAACGDWGTQPHHNAARDRLVRLLSPCFLWKTDPHIHTNLLEIHMGTANSGLHSVWMLVQR